MEYRKDLDVLKGIAIIVVVLFHMGLLKSGYLGVDAFFVINGFLIIPSVFNKILEGKFSFFSYMEKRIVRLLPLIVLASLISLIAGYFLMMPDHYENLAQSVIASNMFSENILDSITTKDYWDVDNDYKPLMHLWYVGILFEFYLFLPLLLYAGKYLAKLLHKDAEKTTKTVFLFFTLLSLIAYLLPSSLFESILLSREMDGFKFYWLPFRFYEIALGGVISLFIIPLISRPSECQMGGAFLDILVIFLVVILGCSLYNTFADTTLATHTVIGGDSTIVSTGLPLNKTILLLLTVFVTGLLICFANRSSIILNNSFLAWIGKKSYSIFIWHQVILAFYRYSFSSSFSLSFVIIFLIATLVVSILSYYYLEKRIKVSHKALVGWCQGALLLMIPSGWLYLHAGVCRDIPELECSVANAHRGMWGEYCDRVYEYDKDFPKNGKINVLVEGVSFGRDFANVLLESNYKDSINLSYVFLFKEGEYMERIKEADYIFTLKAKQKVPSYVWNSKKESTPVWGIGTKNYGACNGIVYKNRNKSDYFQSTVLPMPGYHEANAKRKKEWDGCYIDFMTPVTKEDKTVLVFTPEHKFISQDCSHLTPAGAKYYARLINWSAIFSR